MLARERHSIIMETLRRNRIIKISDIVKQFDVSNETARRDLETLQDQKLVKRIYGGAVLAAQAAVGFDQYASSPRYAQSHAEKAAIGKAAAAMISEGDTIILDIGTTTLEIARNIKNMTNLTVLTNSLAVLNELAGTSIDLFVLGGRLNADELSMHGDLTESALKNFFVDKAFIGAGGVTFNGGVCDYNSGEALTRRVVIQRASKVILVSDSNKFGTNAFAVVCPIEQISTIVTDKNLPKEYISGIKERKINLVLVDSEDEPVI